MYTAKKVLATITFVLIIAIAILFALQQESEWFLFAAGIVTCLCLIFIIAVLFVKDDTSPAKDDMDKPEENRKPVWHDDVLERFASSEDDPRRN